MYKISKQQFQDGVWFEVEESPSRSEIHTWAHQQSATYRGILSFPHERMKGTRLLASFYVERHVKEVEYEFFM